MAKDRGPHAASAEPLVRVDLGKWASAVGIEVPRQHRRNHAVSVVEVDGHWLHADIGS